MAQKAGGIKRSALEIERETEIENEETDDGDSEPENGNGNGNGDHDDDGNVEVESGSQTHYLLSMLAAMLERLPETLSFALCPSAATKTIPVQFGSTQLHTILTRLPHFATPVIQQYTTLVNAAETEEGQNQLTTGKHIVMSMVSSAY